MRVLLVEDDPHLANVVALGLRESRIDTVVAATFDEALELAEAGRYAVMILDVQLPDGSGYDICRILRERGDETPILMLTARGSVEDRVTGLEAGADDYLPKPFYFQELLARLRALSRRSHNLRERNRTIADLTIDLETGDVTRAGRQVMLTAKEWELLEILAEGDGEVVDRPRIEERLWERGRVPSPDAVDNLVERLRMKIDQGFEAKLVHALPDGGYRLGA